MIKSASTDIDYAKLADFFNFLLLVFIMTLGAIWQLLVYLHAKAAVNADDTVGNQSEEVPAADLNTDSTKHTLYFEVFYSVQSV